MSREFNFPPGIAIDRNNNVYVADRNKRRIQKFDSDGNFIRMWGAGVNGGTGHEICRVAADCKNGTQGILGGEFGSVLGHLAIDSGSNVYIVDGGNRRVQKFDSNGNFLQAWGDGVNGGDGPEVCTVAADCENGGFHGTQGGEFSSIFGIGTDGDDKVYVTDSLSDRVQKFDSSGNFVLMWGSGVNGGTGPEVCVESANCQHGDNGTTQGGEFDSPFSVTADKNSGHIYVGDSLNFRIQKFGSANGTGSVEFTLDDEETQPNDEVLQSITFADVTAGVYTITETLPSDWQLDSANCTGASGSLTDQTLSVTVGAGESLTCTFTNTLQLGKIVVIKDTVPDAPQDFNFGFNPLPQIAAPFIFTLDDDADETLSNTQTFDDLDPGSYRLVEQITPGYTATVDCIDPSGGTTINGSEVAVDLAIGETVTCTYTNKREQGSITFVKAVNGGNASPTEWSFGITDGQQDIAHNGQVTIGTGTYTVTEDGPTDYTLTDASGLCAIQDNQIVLTVDALDGTCTITNTRNQGSITFVKTVSGGNALPTEWSFDITDGPQDIAHNGQVTLDTGAYTVTEEGPTDYTLTDAYGLCAIQNNEIVLTVDALGGTCIITNTRNQEAVTFVKVVDGGNASPTEWSFDITDGQQDIAHNGQAILDTGSYTVTEDGPTDYTLTDASGVCAIQDNQIVLTVDALGGTCTITNTRNQGAVTFVKVVDGGDASPTEWSFDITDGPQDIDHNGQATLNTGSYTITENGPVDYTLTSASGLCTIENGEIVLTVDTAGGTCTITNSRGQGSVTFVKVVDGGDALPDDWSFDITDGPQDIANNGQTILDTGSYTVTEDGPADYTLTSASGLCAIENGQIVLTVEPLGGICTITNTRNQGPVTFLKVVDGGDALPDDWSFDVTNGPQDIAHNGQVTLNTETYTVTEDGPTGYTLTSASGLCTPENGQIVLTVDTLGGTCTITNTRDQGTITFVKTVASGDASPSDWHFDVINGPQDVAHNGQVTLNTGSYSVMEDGPGDYTLTNASGVCAMENGQIVLTVDTNGGICSITNEATDQVDSDNDGIPDITDSCPLSGPALGVVAEPTSLCPTPNPSVSAAGLLTGSIGVNMHGKSTFDVSVTFAGNGPQITSVDFTLNFDATCLTFDAATDNNSDGLPDALTGLPASHATSLVENEADGELTIQIAPLSNNPPLPLLADGTLAIFTFGVQNSCITTDGTPKPLSFGLLDERFGDSNGQNVAGRTVTAPYELRFNANPTDIVLDNSNIDENDSNFVIGTLSSLDPDTSTPMGDSHTYRLMESGCGTTVDYSADSNSFQISGTQLQAVSALNFEVQPTYTLCLRTTDHYGGSYEKELTISVNDLNEPPTTVRLSNASVDEHVPTGTVVGLLTTVDDDLLDDGGLQKSSIVESHTYTLPGGELDNNLFQLGGINSDELMTGNEFNHEAQSTYNVRIQTMDSAGQSAAEDFLISINDINEAPVASDDPALEPLIVVNDGTPVNIDVLANDSDPDEDMLTIGAVNTLNTKGSVTTSGSHILYTPPTNETGPDSFLYSLTDGNTLNPLGDEATVSLYIVENNHRGDCNGDAQVNGQDVAVLLFEIFDTDVALDWWRIAEQGYQGSPIGCDSNSSLNSPVSDHLSVTAADITCTGLILFGDDTCTKSGEAINTERRGGAEFKTSSKNLGSLSNDQSQAAQLSAPQGVAATAGQPVDVSISLDTKGNDVASVTFALQLESDAIGFNQRDADDDGIPDALTLNLPDGTTQSVIWNAPEHRLEVAIYALLPQSPQIPDGILATITLDILDNAPIGNVPLPLQSVTLGSQAGIDVAVDGLDGFLRIKSNISGMMEEIYLPIIR